MPQLEKESYSDSITLYLPKIIDNYICNQTTNRSEWVREAGKEFLHLFKERIINSLDFTIEGRKVISISTPTKKVLKEIFWLKERHNLFFSRSEFFRMSIFYKMILEILQKDVKQKTEKPVEDPNTVRIPISKDENGDQVFKVYQVLKKMEF